MLLSRLYQERLHPLICLLTHLAFKMTYYYL
jgi:hypothetical protein